MRKIIALILTLSILSAAAAVPVTVSAETTLSDAAEMYAQVLEDYTTGGYYFALAYIDDDDIPEMIVDMGQMHYTGAQIYSVKNGVLTNTQIYTEAGYLDFSTKNNMIRTYGMRFGYGHIYFSELDENGSIVTLHKFYDNSIAAEGGAEVSYLYSIDETEISEEYYKSRLNTILNDYDWTTFAASSDESSFKVTSSNIEDMKEHPKKYIIGYDGISVYLNDEELEFEEGQEAVRIDGNVMVPMRTIFEAFEATVDWNNEAKTITATSGSKQITMTIGSNEMTIINYASFEVKDVELNTPPQLAENNVTADNYTVVPVRAVSEALNSEVKWDGDTKTVYITNTETPRALITVNYESNSVHYEAFKNSGEFAKAVFKLGIPDSDITYKVADGSILTETEFTKSLNEAFAETDYNDLSFVYYVGHTFADEDENGNFTNMAPDIQSSGGRLAFSKFYDLVKNNVCGTVIIIYDGCFAGKMIDEADLDPRVKIIGACKSDEESYDYYISRLDDTFQVTQIFIKLDDAGQCSLFSYAFYDGIMNNKESVDSNSDNSITFKELFTYIQDKLSELAGKAEFWPEDTSEDSDENAKKKKSSSEQQPYHQTAVCYPAGDSTELFIY